MNPSHDLLARYILDHPGEVSGKTVLDFGSGSGLVAIAAAKAGAACACASEIDPLALVALELNAAANGVFIEPLESDIIGTDARWDTVLAGDMCYERELSGRLTVWLKDLAKDGVRVLIGDPGRNYFPGEGATLTRLASYTVPTSRDRDGNDRRRGNLGPTAQSGAGRPTRGANKNARRNSPLADSTMNGPVGKLGPKKLMNEPVAPVTRARSGRSAPSTAIRWLRSRRWRPSSAP
jgi:SAM-dependent methyltransferase